MKRLGQRFLKDKRALQKITAALEVAPRDMIVEVGPGHGELTEYILAAKPKKIIAIEKDPRLAAKLQESVVSSKSSMTQVVEGDILKILPKIIPYYLLPATNYKLVGNIPYYITGHLLRKISELENKPQLIVFTIQREVAERICATPPRMNLLAASVQFWGEPKIVGYISKKSFRPQPKIDSAIIRIVPRPLRPFKSTSINSHDRENSKTEGYYRFIRILFKQPRKTILNNLREGLKLSQKEVEERLKTLRISLTARPASLSLTDINKLAQIFRNKRV